MDIAEAFRIVRDNGAQQAILEQIVAYVLVVLRYVAHDNVVGIARDDAVQEVAPIDVAIDIAVYVRKVKGIAAVGRQRIELGQGAVDESVGTSFYVHTVAQGVADLRACNLGAAMREHKATAADIVDDGVLYRKQGFRVLGKDCTVTDDTIVSAVDIALRQAIVPAVSKEVDAAPAIGCVVVREIGEHAVGAVAPEYDGMLQRTIGK